MSKRAEQAASRIEGYVKEFRAGRLDPREFCVDTLTELMHLSSDAGLAMSELTDSAFLHFIHEEAEV